MGPGGSGWADESQRTRSRTWNEDGPADAVCGSKVTLRTREPQAVTHHITLRSSPGVSNNWAITKLGTPWLLETGRLQEQLSLRPLSLRLPFRLFPSIKQLEPRQKASQLGETALNEQMKHTAKK